MEKMLNIKFCIYYDGNYIKYIYKSVIKEYVKMRNSCNSGI